MLYTLSTEMSIMPSRKVVLLILVVLVSAASFSFWRMQERIEKHAIEEAGVFSLQEKTQIDIWIQENDLNQYGDPKDTAYAGGTPLFNEATGETTDRYEYILQRHPDRP